MKVGFLFGAGAELSYDMPNGGKFALDIFRRDSSLAKEEFKENRSRIDRGSNYATSWLPVDFETKNIGSFGESVFNHIISDTITNNRSYIIARINGLDKVAESIMNNTHSNHEQKVLYDLKKNFRDINIKHLLSYNEWFSEGNSLFNSRYFALLLVYYNEYTGFSGSDKESLGEIIKSIFQLHIGALSEKLSRNIQENIFSKDEMNLDIFDDLGSSLSINYHSAGVKGLELLSKVKIKNMHWIVEFGFELIEKIYADVLDYKSVVDSYWHYLYFPSTEWAKFCKISVFLHSVREYITKECKFSKNKKGYYDDLASQSRFTVSTIATSNYVNSLIGEKLKEFNDRLIYLNGSINDYYDPYMNAIISYEEFKSYEHFAVPLIFTQSGTKPMTSIDMSIKYVEYYNALKSSDAICSIGFGFNPDDEHINGIIRSLVDRDNKTLIIVDVANDKSESERIDELAMKLKITNYQNIKLVIVNNKRTCNNLPWIDKVYELLSNPVNNRE